MPTPKYYCEYCNRRFNDTPSAREKHLKSKQHVQLRKLWYDSFKYPQQTTQSNSSQEQSNFSREKLFPHIKEMKSKFNFKYSTKSYSIQSNQVRSIFF